MSIMEAAMRKESSSSPGSGNVIPEEQLLFHELALVSSLFHNHANIVSNETIPKSYEESDPLPLGELVSYQVEMHGRVKLIIIEEEDLQMPDPEVYTRLFTELYAASQSNIHGLYQKESLDLRVYGLLADGERNAFFSYDPVMKRFQMDEMIHIMPGCKRALCITLLPQEDLTDFTLNDLGLVEEAIQYANRATAQLESPKNIDALDQGLDDLCKSVWVLPLRGRTKNCWLGLHDDLDQMAAEAALSFCWEQCLEEKRWKDGRNKTYDVLGQKWSKGDSSTGTCVLMCSVMASDKRLVNGYEHHNTKTLYYSTLITSIIEFGCFEYDRSTLQTSTNQGKVV
ncbi:uncharacterized protein EV420DRAFT_1473215 [Desarmillaria tabescens]|uniref:Uncharacterized protein n=1 Tax=Armillaria tabescens TaxID=1929756 RepID=A0AA39NQT5_ARMTA|nr:uncharacterized protein EV420DRAFT_1473215 [Desarmillaria tabescens]KAK0470118.1 hypothetical protein EV420DRAFT_1473215 [Desarmillaria tabescens]